MPRHDVIRARDLKVSKMVQRSFDNVRAVRPVPKSLIERALWPGPTKRRHSDGQDIDGIWRHCTLQQLQRFVALYQIGARQSHGDFCRSRRVKQDDARWLLDEVGGRMRKSVYFDAFDGPGWPSPSQLQPYFLGPRERRWIFARRNDCWGLSAEGVDGTAHLPRNKGRIDLNLTILGNFNHGILLHYHKSGGARGEFYYSKGDLSRLKEWVKTMHGDLMPVGLYIPFESAWKAVKEFMERDGALPNSIEWIAGEDIPDDAFPDPYLYRLAQS